MKEVSQKVSEQRPPEVRLILLAEDLFSDPANIHLP